MSRDIAKLFTTKETTTEEFALHRGFAKFLMP